jgi:hypothetical protein
MSFAENYSFIDRSLHHLAYSVPGVQTLLSEIESDIYKKELQQINSDKEVFVTGLPRSGTTLLLDFLYKTDEFCTYSYRHMPFILAPLLWKKIANPFSKKAESVERAHGDGMEVSFDSPEAFEEVIWLSYLKDRFVKQDHLVPLNLKNTSKKFADKFKLTIKKLILEAKRESGNELTTSDKRYISKNNANCSRLPVLKKLFPNATILVPFREPLSHIGSLMKQHQQFCEMHKDDAFAKNYMKWLGHYDFGENFKPINFDQWLDKSSGKPNYNDHSFWLQYWIAGYTHLLQQSGGNIHLVDYNKLLLSPEESLSQIAKVTQVNSVESFTKNSEKVRAPTSKPSDSANINPELLEQANLLYQQLCEAAL